MRILAIETSCDETSAAVVEKLDNGSVTVHASTVASSSDLHALTGGIIPERAAREQIQYIIPIILQALLESEGKKLNADLNDAYIIGRKILAQSIDAIAITQGPGLIGSLLVGVEAAKTLSVAFDKPIVPVNHLLAHIYANFIDTNSKSLIPNHKDSKLNPNPYPLTPNFPFIGLIVSGGHTDLLYFKEHGVYTWLGGTRDDAAGEALDKTGRLLGLEYPAGPVIEKRALLAQKKEIKFSRALIHSEDFDFSFSGLKTEVARFIQKHADLSESDIHEISYAIQDAITDVLVAKTINAAEKYSVPTILIGGGVSANNYLQEKFQSEISNKNLELNFFCAQKKFTTDNAAMIGAYAALNFKPVQWAEIKANPELYFDKV